jgi:hypothetical protein
MEERHQVIAEGHHDHEVQDVRKVEGGQEKYNYPFFFCHVAAKLATGTNQMNPAMESSLSGNTSEVIVE